MKVLRVKLKDLIDDLKNDESNISRFNMYVEIFNRFFGCNLVLSNIPTNKKSEYADLLNDLLLILYGADGYFPTTKVKMLKVIGINFEKEKGVLVASDMKKSYKKLFEEQDIRANLKYHFAPFFKIYFPFMYQKPNKPKANQ